MSTVAGMGGIGATSNGSSSIAYLGYVIAGLNIFTALLTSFQKFIMAAEKSETHATISREFAAFYRNIALELSLSPGDRMDCVELCKMCRNEYDRMMTVSPNVPQKIINQFKANFPHARHKPDIANGLSDMHIWEKAGQAKTDDAHLKMRTFYRLMYRRKSNPSVEKNLKI